jgi:hypothetical protein
MARCMVVEDQTNQCDEHAVQFATTTVGPKEVRLPVCREHGAQMAAAGIDVKDITDEQEQQPQPGSDQPAQPPVTQPVTTPVKPQAPRPRPDREERRLPTSPEQLPLHRSQRTQLRGQEHVSGSEASEPSSS